MKSKLSKTVAVLGLLAGSVTFGSAIPASAGASCGTGWHDHYHFPYAHRDDWNYLYGSTTNGVHQHVAWNSDHSYQGISGTCNH